jgi:hypothetical protein
MLEKLKAASQRLHRMEAGSLVDVPTTVEKPASVLVQYRLCGACGGHDFWQRPDGGWVCQTCHPDPRTLRAWPGLSAEAQVLLTKAEAGGITMFVSPTLERIAKEHGIAVSPSTTPSEIVARLRKLGQGAEP